MFKSIISSSKLKRAQLIMREIRQRFNIPAKYLLVQANLTHSVGPLRLYSVYWDFDTHHSDYHNPKEGRPREPKPPEYGGFVIVREFAEGLMRGRALHRQVRRKKPIKNTLPKIVADARRLFPNHPF